MNHYPYVSVCDITATGWQRPTGCLVFRGHLSRKSPIISGSYVEIDLQLKALYGSSPPCSDTSAEEWIVHGRMDEWSTSK